ncbi:MAG: hypothetical protein E7607_08760 [Ruminococcaceae bacterium]|nr:hypothetical protein [Oscillospiraceae bacterium]
MFTVMKREIGSFFKSYRGYAFMAIFIVIFSIFQLIYHGHDVDEINLVKAEGGYPFYTLEQTLELLPLAIAAAIPMLTYDIFYEERIGGAGNLLRSLPLSAKGIFVGKYLACEILFVIVYAVINLVMWLLGFYRNIEAVKTIISILSYILVFNALLAINMFVAAVCKRKFVALGVSYGVCAVLVVLFVVGSKNTGAVAKICSFLSVIGSFTPSLYGVLDLTALTLQITLCGLFAYLAYVYFKRDIIL